MRWWRRSRQRLPKIKVGPGSDPSAEMGPLVTKQHRDTIAGHLASGAEQGADLVVDGRQHPLYDPDDGGFFLGVSLMDKVTPAMDSYRAEIFGPVLQVMRVDTYADAMKVIDANPYGNGTAIFTRDGGAARQFQFDVEVGMVGINVPIPVPVAYYSFGGWKASLFGDTHMYGPDGISLLHPRQGRHLALARSGHEQGRPGVPAHAVAGAPAIRHRRPPARVDPVAHRDAPRMPAMSWSVSTSGWVAHGAAA